MKLLDQSSLWPGEGEGSLLVVESLRKQAGRDQNGMAHPGRRFQRLGQGAEVHDREAAVGALAEPEKKRGEHPLRSLQDGDRHPLSFQEGDLLEQEVFVEMQGLDLFL